MLNAARQLAACNAVHHVERRLCCCLLETTDRTGSQVLPLTQAALARTLGVRRTTVPLMLNQLAQRGLIDNHRARIPIVDRDALEKASCECYRLRRRAENLPERREPFPQPADPETR